MTLVDPLIFIIYVADDKSYIGDYLYYSEVSDY